MKIYLITSDGDGGIVNTAYATRELADEAYCDLIAAVYGKRFDTYDEASAFDTSVWDDWNAWVSEVELIGGPS